MEALAEAAAAAEALAEATAAAEAQKQEEEGGKEQDEEDREMAAFAQSRTVEEAPNPLLSHLHMNSSNPLAFLDTTSLGTDENAKGSASSEPPVRARESQMGKDVTKQVVEIPVKGTPHLRTRYRSCALLSPASAMLRCWTCRMRRRGTGLSRIGLSSFFERSCGLSGGKRIILRSALRIVDPPGAR